MPTEPPTVFKVIARSSCWTMALVAAGVNATINSFVAEPLATRLPMIVVPSNTLLLLSTVKPPPIEKRLDVPAPSLLRTRTCPPVNVGLSTSLAIAKKGRQRSNRLANHSCFPRIESRLAAK
jgi:hypothetical protein